MAMLVLDDVFVRTWGERARGGPSPDGGRGYWPTVIERRASGATPTSSFWAEAYWDLEPVLVDAGLRRLLRQAPLRPARARRAGGARSAPTSAPTRRTRRTRCASSRTTTSRGSPPVLDAASDRAAAVVALTLPGVALLHEGQADGRRVRVPVTLGRRPAEAPDVELRAWYDRLLAALGDGMRRGRVGAGRRRGLAGQPLVRAPRRRGRGSTLDDALPGRRQPVRRPGRRPRAARPAVRRGPLTLEDALSGERYERDADQVRADGLYVALEAHGVHVLWWSRDT